MCKISLKNMLMFFLQWYVLHKTLSYNQVNRCQSRKNIKSINIYFHKYWCNFSTAKNYFPFPLRSIFSKEITFRTSYLVTASIAKQLNKLGSKEINAFVRGEKQQTHNHLNFGQISEMEANTAMKSQWNYKFMEEKLGG